MLIDSTEIEVLNALRFLTIGVGVGLLVISSFSAVEAFVNSWPRRLKYGLTVRWVGRFTQVGFMTIFVIHRINKPWDWRITPFILLSFSLLLVGTWLTKDAEERLYYREPNPEKTPVKGILTKRSAEKI